MPRGAGDAPSRRGALRAPSLVGGSFAEGTRNDGLTSVAGRLHNGERSLTELTSDLMAANEEYCSPPLPAEEVAKIARSIHRREPCKAGPVVTDKVLAVVDALEEASEGRRVRGIRGATGWSIYHAGLDLLRRYGREHPEGVELSIDVRTWAFSAGTSAASVSRFIRRCPLVRYQKRRSGRR